MFFVDTRKKLKCCGNCRYYSSSYIGSINCRLAHAKAGNSGVVGKDGKICRMEPHFVCKFFKEKEMPEVEEKKGWFRWWMVLIAVALLGGMSLLIVGGYSLSTVNSSTNLINLIKAKQEDNKNEYDLMWKKISQVAQVSQSHADALKEIFIGHAEARTGKGGGKNAVMNWIKESVPNVDLKTFDNLSNIIVGSRDRFAQRQKEILDFKREHDNLIDQIPSGWVLSIAGHRKQEVTIVTSGRTKEAFQTGEDNDVNVFEKKSNGKVEK